MLRLSVSVVFLLATGIHSGSSFIFQARLPAKNPFKGVIGPAVTFKSLSLPAECAKFTTILNCLPPVATASEEPTISTYASQFLNCSVSDANDTSTIKRLVMDLEERLEDAQLWRCHVLEEEYERCKLEKLVELARLYKERVVKFALSKTNFKWNDMIVKGYSLDEYKLTIIQKLHPDLQVELVTEVHWLLEANERLPPFKRSYNSNGFIRDLIAEMRYFKFRDGDPHKELSNKICDIVEHYFFQHKIPTERDLPDLEDKNEWMYEYDEILD